DPAPGGPPAARPRRPRPRGLRRRVRRGRRGQDRRRPVPPQRHPKGRAVRRRLGGLHRAGDTRPDRHRGALGRRRHGHRPDGHGRQRGGPPGARRGRGRPLLGVHRHRLARPPLGDPFHTGPAGAVRGRKEDGPRGERHSVAPARPWQRHLRHSREREDPPGSRRRDHLGPRPPGRGAPRGGDPLLQQRRRLPLPLRRPAGHGAGLRLPAPRAQPPRRRRGVLRRLQPLPQHKRVHPRPVPAAGEGLHPHLRRAGHQDPAPAQPRRGRRRQIAGVGRDAVARGERVYRV
ncbi:MAG: hypothetical protein AVDCRST_MAG22-140, partial [uncultured Rubrobacteraceae bacterium]